MVSTVAALTKFHKPEFATDALCSMILDRRGHERSVSLRYNVQRSPVKAVISKIVDSIYLNVVNAGHDLGGLPVELGHLHPHLLDDLTFAGIVMGIERSEQDVVIRSDRFLSDLTLWLLLHFHGRIVVSVDKTVLFEKLLGPSSRTARIMIKALCLEDAMSCMMLDAPVEAFVSVGDELCTFLTGKDGTDSHPCSYTRQALYDVENLTSYPRPAKLRLLNHAECNSIANVAKVIMDWLLKVPVVGASGWLSMSFRVSLIPEVQSDISIGDLLQKHPGLQNLDTGRFCKPDLVLRHHGEGSSDESSDDEALADTSASKTSLIFEWFPMAHNLLEQIRPRCFCSACKSEAKVDLCKRGCLREAALTQLFVLLTHGICDAFGAKDVSGRADSDDQVTGMTTLLLEVLSQQLIRWDTWFALVACSTTGVPLDTFCSSPDEGSSSWAAIQYGSLVAVAPWLDIAERAKVKGCFGIVTIEGNLQGVPDDAGLVCCEMSQDAQPPSDSRPTEPCASEFNQTQIEMALQLDTLKVEEFTAIFRTDQNLYRLMTSVRSDRNVRIIDPSRVIMGSFYNYSIQCNHDPTSPLNSSTDAINVYDFDHILAEWSSSDKPPTIPTIRMSKVLDSQLKINTLLSIVQHGSFIRDANSCCLNCAIKRATASRSRGQPYIINTTSHSAALVPIEERKRQMEL